ncbi:hypothetical protein CUMW_133280 [Citrus unshiu]|nr:hypothetical protein CUMW_133280 [Citrus unshiu]
MGKASISKLKSLKTQKGSGWRLRAKSGIQVTLAVAVKLEAWCSRSMALGSRLVVDWPRTHNSKLQTRNKSRSSMKRGLSSSLE